MTKRPLVVAFLVPNPDLLTGLSSYTFSIVAALEQNADREIVFLTSWSESEVRKHVELRRTRIVRISALNVPLISPYLRGRAAYKVLQREGLGGSPIVSTVPLGLYGRKLRQF